MAGRKGNCLFCGNKLIERAKEHVIPKWVQEHLRIAKNRFVSEEYENLDHGQILSLGAKPRIVVRRNRDHTFGGLLNGHICKDCNCNWMSGLETEVTSDLKGLMSGQIQLSDLDDQSRITLARWTVKTAYALSFALGKFDHIPVSHPKGFGRNHLKIPDNVIVVGNQIATNKVTGHSISGSWYVSQGKGPKGSVQAKLIQKSNYRISFQLDRLHLMIAHYANPGLRMVLKAGMHVPIYPLGPQPISYVNPLPSNFNNIFVQNHPPSFHEIFNRTLIVGDVTPEDLLPGTHLVHLILPEGS